MLRYLSQWVNVSKKYEDNLNENLQPDTLAFKSGFNFPLLSQEARINHTLFFNHNTNTETELEYESRNRKTFLNLLLTNGESDKAQLLSEFNLYSYKQHRFGLHSRLNFGEEEGKALASVNFLYGFGSKFLFNLGFDQFFVNFSSGDKLFTKYDKFNFGLSGKLRDDLNAGAHATINCRGKLNNAQVLVEWNAKDTSALVHFNRDRVEVNKEDKYENTLTVHAHRQVNSDLLAFKSLKIGSGVDYTGGFLLNLDNSTQLKTKLTNGSNLTLSLTHRFRNLFDFSVIGDFVFVSAKRNVTVSGSNEVLAHVKSKFGVKMEVLDS